MYANYEMDMPKRYVDLSDDEMEYDGGFLNFAIGIALNVAGVGLSIAAATTGNKTLETLSHASTIVGAALTLGTTTLAIGVAGNAVKSLVTQTTLTAVKRVTGEELKDAACYAVVGSVFGGDYVALSIGIGTW